MQSEPHDTPMRQSPDLPRVTSLRDRLRAGLPLTNSDHNASGIEALPDQSPSRLLAIPTIYKGVTFRSRLEARWAAFFDEMDEPWEFEPEGFELPSGRYLPDFWLPKFQINGYSPGTYWEVKPSVDAIDEDKIRDLVSLSRRPCCVSIGPPWDGQKINFIPKTYVEKRKTQFGSETLARAEKIRGISFWEPK